MEMSCSNLVVVKNLFHAAAGMSWAMFREASDSLTSGKLCSNSTLSFQPHEYLLNEWKPPSSFQHFNDSPNFQISQALHSIICLYLFLVFRMVLKLPGSNLMVRYCTLKLWIQVRQLYQLIYMSQNFSSEPYTY
jgi:hypothetical protein